MFKMIATDVDGTLIDSNHEISDYTKEIFKEVYDSGLEIVIATGRDYRSASQIAEQLGFDENKISIVSNNGMLVKSIKNDYFVQEQNVSYEDCKNFESLAEKYYLGMLYLCEERIYFQMDDTSYSDFEIGMDPKRMIFFNDEIKTERIPSLNHLKDKFKDGSPVQKIVFIQNDQYLELIKERVAAELPTIYTLLMVSPGWAEIMPRTVNKGDALLRLASHMGIESSQIIAFGDSDNDLTMIKQVGLGVAMANAREALKIIADDTTTSNDENGVAQYIEQHLLRR